MITTETIIYPEEYWANSIFSIARHYGGCIIKGKEYVIVNKEGVSMQKLADKAKLGDVLIPAGEPADLILKEWQPIYRALGRDKLFEYLKTQSCDLKEAKKYVKQLKEKKK
jgi:hypothetical protein